MAIDPLFIFGNDLGLLCWYLNPALVPVGTTLLWGRDSISLKENVLTFLFRLT